MKSLISTKPFLSPDCSIRTPASKPAGHRDCECKERSARMTSWLRHSDKISGMAGDVKPLTSSAQKSAIKTLFWNENFSYSTFPLFLSKNAYAVWLSRCSSNLHSILRARFLRHWSVFARDKNYTVREGGITSVKTVLKDSEIQGE